MLRSDSAALWAFVRLGWRRSLTDKTTTIGVVILYWVILVIFWGLWQATSMAELLQANTRPANLFWYLAVTECIACAIGSPFRFVEAEINNGDVASALMRPIPHSLATLAEWCGQTCYRFAILAIAGCTAGLLITHELPITLATLPMLLLSIAMACVSVLLCQLMIGYATTWVTSAAPVFWIWQKSFFVLGGLIIPLTLYPHTLQIVAKLSPFASMLFAPGSLLLEGANADLVATLAMQVLWLVVLSIATWAVDRAAVARFMKQGI